MAIRLPLLYDELVSMAIPLQTNLACQWTTPKTQLFETFESAPLAAHARPAIYGGARSKPQMEPQLSGKVRFKRFS